MIFLASYLAQKRELLAAGIGRFGLPRAKDLGPLLLAWGASLAVLFLERDMGASLLLFGVFVVMVWVATGRPAYLVLGLVLFAIGRVRRVPRVLARPGARRRVAARARARAWSQDQAYQIAQGWFALATGGMVGTGLGLGSPTLIPYVGSDFILAAFGEELGMLGVSAVLLLVPRARRARAADRDRAPRHVRAAARGRAHDLARAAGVRDRRRGPPADPAHRRAAAARVLRRIEPRRHVRAARAAGPHLGGSVGPDERRSASRSRTPASAEEATA